MQNHFVTCKDAKIRTCLAGDKGARVVFVSAFPGMALDWSLVQPKVATLAQTSSYDRAGVGRSSRFTGETKTLSQYVTELNCLMSDLAANEPVVLVAHSIGGVIARQSYTHFPDRVKGMVLVDSSHEQQNQRLSGGDGELGAMEKSLKTELRLARLGILNILIKVRGKRMIPPGFQGLLRAAKAEFLDGIASVKQCRASIAEFRALKSVGKMPTPGLSNLPLIVLEAGRNPAAGWHDLQVELANLSSRGELRLVANSGHYVQARQPSERGAGGVGRTRMSSRLHP